MLRSSKAHKHRRPSKAVRYATLAGVTGAAVAVPLLTATSASAASVSEWDTVAQCESGGNWSINTGNGFFGGLQFTSSTWAAYGGTAYAPQANQATKAQQIAIGEKVLAGQGKGAWPVCGKGLSGPGGSGPAPSTNTNTTTHSAPAQQQSTTQSRPAQPQRPAQPASRGNARPTVIKKGDGEYKVKAGDTLSKIATAHHVKGGWKKLFDLNKKIVTDADVIYPGQQLHLH
ncbi:transglycosylase family protein [Streptomyces fuscigenes]|uniref:transglycosylase family protein n=1 Tax=Streptomyces fuscigenes TaxID=1528880 RepID=UPI001F2FB50D|nr:transglycosylase family protein [Streptomyces fuscigenes]MCF3963871.1 transglycosylase family protein [Streptomyces fuscigenes]